MKKNSALFWILRKTKKSFFPLIILCIIGAVSSALSVLMSLISKNLIDIATKAVYGNLLYSVLGIVFIIVTELILQVLYSRLNIIISGKTEMEFKTSIFNSLLNKELSELYKFHSGELLNRLTSDISVVVSGFINIIPEIISLITRLAGAFYVLFKLDYTLGFIYLLASPLFFLVIHIYRDKLKVFHKKCQETDGKTRGFIQEALQNILVIKAFGTEKPICDETNRLQEVNYKFKLKKNLISIFANILLFITFTISYYFVLVWGAYKLSLGLITMGTLTALLQIVSQIQGPLKSASSIIPQYYSAIASAERLIELENLKNCLAISENMLYNNIYEEMLSVEFSDVTFYYEKNLPILTHFSYTINKGDFVAIRGISGVGKSTTLKLMLGVIEPVSGEINIILKNGDKIPVNSQTRKLFAYVPQGNMILSGTIRENITFYKKGVSKEDVIKACKVARIYDFIKTLPLGLDTKIGEKGLGLSEGQIQRLAIARAVISDAPILLLDEATSALDENTEHEFLTEVKGLNNKTCIIVSHKEAAFKMCNKIMDY